MEIKIDCVLCKGERSVFLLSEDKLKTMQCLSCGYASSDRYLGKPEDNETYKKLHLDMQKMAIIESDRIWIPSLLTLPNGLISPINVENKLLWSVVPAVDITEEEKENYPNGEGGYYEKRYDNIHTKLFNSFNSALKEITTKKSNEMKLELPKLKKKQ
jgi:Zn ribbon nucleic-acid-binding protein